MTQRIIQLFGQGFNPPAVGSPTPLDSLPAEVTITLSGNEIFSGPINTLYEAPVRDGVKPLICTFTIPMEFVGTMPMTCSVTNGIVVFGQILANYSQKISEAWKNNPELRNNYKEAVRVNNTALALDYCNQIANPPFSQQDLLSLQDATTPYLEKEAILKSHNCFLVVSSGPYEYMPSSLSESRTNVTIDGITQVQQTTSFNWTAPVDPWVENPSSTWDWRVSNGSVLAYDLNIAPAYI